MSGRTRPRSIRTSTEPGEITTSVGKMVMEACPKDQQCLIVAPVNGYVGYIVSPSEYEGGTYAADACFFGPQTSTLIKDGVTAALSGLQ